jgi:hypothetical protein
MVIKHIQQPLLMPLRNSIRFEKHDDFVSPLISAMLIVMFLFFIDEGYYNFNWMAQWGNWIAFGMYMIIFFPLLWLVAHFLLRSVDGWKKIMFMAGIGIPLTLVFFWLIS